MKTSHAALLSIAVTVLSIIGLTASLGAPSMSQLLWTGTPIFAVAFVVLKLFGGPLRQPLQWTSASATWKATIFHHRHSNTFYIKLWRGEKTPAPEGSRAMSTVWGHNREEALSRATAEAKEKNYRLPEPDERD